MKLIFKDRRINYFSISAMQVLFGRDFHCALISTVNITSKEQCVRGITRRITRFLRHMFKN